MTLGEPPLMPVPSGRTRLLLVIADPVARIRALPVYNGLFASRGIDAAAVALEVPAAALATVAPALALCPNLAGLVVTLPHKQSLARLCHELSPTSRLVGAVNTVRIAAGGLVGELFDGIGLVAAAREAGIGIKGKRVLLLGAGGSARAIGFALAAEGAAALTVANRSAAPAAKLAGDLRTRFPMPEIASGRIDDTADIVINATTLGMREGDALPLDPGRLRAGTAVIDIVIARPTEFLGAARARGCTVLDGRPMLRHQLELQLDFLGLAG